jgi:hypothetical protein
MENRQPRLRRPQRLQRQAMSAEDMDVPDIEENAVMDATSNILADAAARTPATTPATTVMSPARTPARNPARSPVRRSDGFEIVFTTDLALTIGQEEEEEVAVAEADGADSSKNSSEDDDDGGEREINGWKFHYQGWSDNKAARSGATQDNLFPGGRKGCLDKKILKKYGLTQQ